MWHYLTDWPQRFHEQTPGDTLQAQQGGGRFAAAEEVVQEDKQGDHGHWHTWSSVNGEDCERIQETKLVQQKIVFMLTARLLHVRLVL